MITLFFYLNIFCNFLYCSIKKKLFFVCFCFIQNNFFSCNCEKGLKAGKTWQIHMPSVCLVPLLPLDWSAVSFAPAPALAHASVTSWTHWGPWQPSLCPSPAGRQSKLMLILKCLYSLLVYMSRFSEMALPPPAGWCHQCLPPLTYWWRGS